MPPLFDICIRGDGVVGRALALLLAQARLRVALVSAARHEAAAPEDTDVRAYALNAASREMLLALRAWPDAVDATPVRQMKVCGDSGGQVDFDSPPVQSTASDSQGGALAWIVDVAPLHRLLVEAGRYQPQIKIVTEPVAAALTVICEGRRGAGHEGVDVSWTISHYPQDAIAARLESALPHGGVARQWFSGGDVLALLPMGGDAGHALALVWSLASERARQRLALNDEAFCAELQTLCGAQTGTLRLTSARASWPLALCLAGRWVGPGWALAGDAAHTVHPLAGQGLNLGLADAACLAKVLSEREYWRTPGDEKLLRRYERARKADTAAVAAVTDGLQGLFAQPGEVWQMLRNRGMNGFARSGPIKTWLTRRAAGL